MNMKPVATIFDPKKVIRNNQYYLTNLYSSKNTEKTFTRGIHLKGAFIKAGALFQIISVMLLGLEMSYLNALMNGSSWSRTSFTSHSKFA